MHDPNHCVCGMSETAWDCPVHRAPAAPPQEPDPSPASIAALDRGIAEARAGLASPVPARVFEPEPTRGELRCDGCGESKPLRTHTEGDDETSLCAGCEKPRCKQCDTTLVLSCPDDCEEPERCESGCSEPVTHHDVEGVPLCQACWDELIAAGPDAYEDTPEEAAVLVGETVVVPTAVPPGSGEVRPTRVEALCRDLMTQFRCDAEVCEDDPATCVCGGDECWRCAAAQVLKPPPWDRAAPALPVQARVGYDLLRVHEGAEASRAVARWLARKATGKALSDMSDWAQDRYIEEARALLAPAYAATPEVPQGPVEAAGRRIRWRVGRSVGRTLYLDNVLVGLMDDASLARTVVTALTEMGQRIDGEAGNDAATTARLQAHAEGRAEGLREAYKRVLTYLAKEVPYSGRAREELRQVEIVVRSWLAASPPQPLACACVETRYHGGKCSARPDDGERACASCIEYGHDVSAPAKETP